MNHSVEELIDIVCRYYPRGISGDDPVRAETDENRRLVDARRLRAAAEGDHWRSLQQRLGEEFPGTIGDSSMLLALGTHDAAFCGSLYPPDPTHEYRRSIRYSVSILVPYYILYTSQDADGLKGAKTRKVLRSAPSRFASVIEYDTMHILPASMVKPEFRDPEPNPDRAKDVNFDFSPDEQPYAARVAQEIEATWGYERMPPEVGEIIVPDVATDQRWLGEATLHDCLFSDDW